MTKRPFQDADGLWWIYRSDDPMMHTPMGPFFTALYASEQAERAERRRVPFPPSLAHRQPRKPYRTPQPKDVDYTTVSYRSRAWEPREVDITDGVNYND